MLSIRFERPAEKFIEKVRDKILLKRIVNKIDKLKENPFPSEAVRVEEYKKDKVCKQPPIIDGWHLVSGKAT